MRPEVIAFRELETLVRRLSDQLAGYRRRALAAEAKTRGLEQSLERSVEKGEAALSAARAETATVRRLLDDALQNAASWPVGREQGGAPADPALAANAVAIALESVDLSAYGDIAVENERLRAKLSEARERTSVLVERVRFLRQQMLQGAER